MALGRKDTELIDEMSIVDVFTKLIFDADAQLANAESLVLDYLGQVNPTLINVPRRDISEFLRSMSVDEMIHLVAKVKNHMDEQHRVVAARKNNAHRHVRG